MRRGMQEAVQAGADAVECRLDVLSRCPTAPGELESLLDNPPLPVIVTCRPVRQGGRFEGDESARLRLLRLAGRAGAAFVDVELDVPKRSRPKSRAILSHHDFARCPEDLDRIAAELDGSDAAVNKVAFAGAGPEDALRALDVLRRCRKPTLALAMGEHGLMSRILARKFGAFGTFAALAEGSESAPGQPTIEQFRRTYRWDSLGPGTTVYGVIGCPIAHSRSPAIQNAALAAAGLDAVYLPLRVEPGRENFTRFMDALLARPWMDWGGLSVTIPHKENALAYVGPDRCEELARRIGAVNTVCFLPGGELRGHNTDYAAALDALCSAMGIAREGLSGRGLAVLGAGGAARAIVAALAHYGADVTIYNRTVDRARRLGSEFSCRFAGLEAAPSTAAEIVINCTPIGMHPHVDASPLERIPRGVKVVFDTIYNPPRTRLLHQASQAGCLCVSGLEMFVNQGCAQFELWTHRPAPREVMRQALMDSIR
jgi:3-dehydroquinate dehydratase/shikimate dehydrogenase